MEHESERAIMFEKTREKVDEKHLKHAFEWEGGGKEGWTKAKTLVIGVLDDHDVDEKATKAAPKPCQLN